MKTEKAINKIVKELNEDKGYYIAWQSSIAMSFYDVVNNDYVLCCDRKSHKDRVLKACNEAADNFLQLLMSK